MKYRADKSTRISLPEKFDESLEALLNDLDLSLRKKITLAESIRELSKIYNQGGVDNSTIWQEKRFRAAYASYFLPLNFVRLSAVLREAQHLGLFNDIDTIVDVGSGMGTTEWALHELALGGSQKLLNIEASKEAVALHHDFFKLRGLPPPTHVDTAPKGPNRILGIFSYSLNEMPDTPILDSAFDSLIVVEPSTHHESRSLMQVRSRLIEKGFNILAPCTHALGCPLLTHSKKDWCHFRIFWERPMWMQQLEQPLGFNNRSLTYSYLIASKTVNNPAGYVRVVGDTLNEKGKTKQAICRSDKREFVSWLHRHKGIANLPRGSVIQLPQGFEEKGNEVRVSAQPSLIWSPGGPDIDSN